MYKLSEVLTCSVVTWHSIDHTTQVQDSLPYKYLHITY